MKLLNKIKMKYYFKFNKTHFSYKNENDFYNYTYNTVKDTYLFIQAEKIANECSCKILDFISDDWTIDRRIISIYANKENYIKFCKEYCKNMGEYIEDIKI